MAKRLTTEEFVKRAKKVHGDLYDYSLVEYRDCRTRAELFCKICEKSFFQTPSNHLSGSGCSHCAYKKKSILFSKNKQDFIMGATMIHGEKYSYEDVIYKNSNSKIKIRCPKHGFFRQIPSHHLAGQGCPKYSKDDFRIGLAKFIERSKEIHGDKYDYSLANYKNCDTKVKIICPEHGGFKQTPSNHYKARNPCPKCHAISVSKRVSMSTKHFINISRKTHGDKYDYSKSVYESVHKKIKIICPDHGPFEQMPSNHYKGHGCKKCRIYNGEASVIKFLENRNIKFKHDHWFPDCRNKMPLRFDFYIEKYNLIIEYDGKQHFKSLPHWGGDEAFLDVKKRDKIKNKYCKDNNISLIRIPYTEFDNIEEILEDYFEKYELQ